jgi:hypothetical protein
MIIQQSVSGLLWGSEEHGFPGLSGARRTWSERRSREAAAGAHGVASVSPNL